MCHISVALITVIYLQISCNNWQVESSSKNEAMSYHNVLRNEALKKTMGSKNRAWINRRQENLLLFDGNSESEGTVLVNIDGRWSAVCDDNWSLREATVVCRQLGFPYAVQATTRDHFATNGQYPYGMDDVHCNGNETNLFECEHWKDNDCTYREEAGVVCLNPTATFVYNPRNPRLHGINKAVLEVMRKQKFRVISRKPWQGDGFAIVIEINNNQFTHDKKSSSSFGGICPDRFFGAESNVFCRSIGYSFAENYKSVPLNDPILTKNYPILYIGHCFGNETSLNDCVTFASPNGVPCHNKSLGVSVLCTDGLPDIVPDTERLESSAYAVTVPLFMLSCALEENCFPPIVYGLISKQPRRALTLQRRLLRFSSIIHNKGTKAFKPFLPREEWVWHACHMHYHSMKIFSSYEIVDAHKFVLAVGHKASFCLEDNECEPGVRKQYICSTTLSTRGDQGISPGCADSYLHDYDCQWIDITDVPLGAYEFRAIFNPNMLVPEETYFNNAVRCHLTIDKRSTITLKNCTLAHPLDL